MAVSGFCGGYNFFFSCILFSVSYIFTDCTLENPCFLKHHTVAEPERITGHVLYIVAVNRDTALIRIIETHKQVDYSGFTAAGRTYNSYLLTALYVKIKVLDKLFFGNVREVNVVNLYVSAYICKHLVVSVGYFIVAFGEGKYASCRCKRRL